MKNARSAKNSLNFPLDTVSEKKPRGPKWTVQPTALRGRADNWRTILEQVWPRLWPALEEARTRTEADVRTALEEARPYQNEFVPHAAVILRALNERNFPRTNRGRINFLADSAAGLGTVTPRRSRDICAEQRALAKKKGEIIRWEYYIECSCGYKGHSMGHACPLCEAAILFPVRMF